MSYDLYIGDESFSSWSLRGWLMFEKFGIPYTLHRIGLYSGTFAADMAALAPARFVPVIRTPEGQVIGETLAIAETLAEAHPEKAMWPVDPAARARARWLAAEMCCGFMGLREQCNMQLRVQYPGFAASDATLADLKRLEQIWDQARADFPSDGPWLFGAYSLADAFFAPVAARIAGYDLPVSETTRAYVKQHLTDPAFLAWRAEGMKVTYDPSPYPLDIPSVAWPAEG
jgi:glutathione S-transferase